MILAEATAIAGKRFLPVKIWMWVYEINTI